MINALKIPDYVCIFWDNPDTNPGSGWTEITSSIEGKYILLTYDRSGEEGVRVGPGTLVNDEDKARVIRLFKKNDTTVEYEFPIGSLVLYEQCIKPDGFTMETDVVEYVKCGNSKIVENVGSENWEVDYAQFTFIRKTEDQVAWDGLLTYALCLYARNGEAPDESWEKITNFGGRHLKIGECARIGVDSGDSALEDSAYIKFSLIKKVIGKMKDYDDVNSYKVDDFISIEEYDIENSDISSVLELNDGVTVENVCNFLDAFNHIPRVKQREYFHAKFLPLIANAGIDKLLWAVKYAEYGQIRDAMKALPVETIDAIKAVISSEDLAGFESWEVM